MDERVRSSITLVLGEVEPDSSTCDGDEQREARLELMLPLPLETEALVPGDGPPRVLDVQDGDDLLLHGAEGATSRGSRAAPRGAASRPRGRSSRRPGRSRRGAGARGPWRGWGPSPTASPAAAAPPGLKI